MSFGQANSQSFIGPLSGRTATFILSGREDNLAFARTTAAALAGLGRRCSILDLDAFYSSNSESIFGSLPAEWTNESRIFIPGTDSEIEEAVALAISESSDTMIIDSMNTLYHLLAADDGSSRTRTLSFTTASLSYLARNSAKSVIFTMYRREGFGRSTVGRSISGMTDISVTVERDGESLRMRCDRGTAWPGGRLSIRIP